jgi:hypothetical protein
MLEFSAAIYETEGHARRLLLDASPNHVDE